MVARVHQGAGLFVTLGACVAVLWPVVTQRPDSFPLSTFPMFAAERGMPQLQSLKGVRSDGTRVSLPPEMLGTSEVMQARAVVAGAAAGGKAASLKLCRTVAKRLRKSERFADIEQLELTADQYDSIKYFTESRTPFTSRILAQCSARPKAGSGS